MSLLIPNNMTMAEIERHCKAKAKRRQAALAKFNAKTDEIQKKIDTALKELDKNLKV